MAKFCIECERSGRITPVFGKGYCKSHQYKREDYDRRSITQRSIDKAKEEKKRKPGWFNEPEFQEAEPFRVPLQPSNTEKEHTQMYEWFKSQRERMTGKCVHCLGKTEKYNDEKFHYSIAHLFAKAYFPSIATHPENWIELCYYGESCHANFDNKMINITDLNCFDEVVRKFAILYPLMTREEKRRVPNVLLQYLETEI